MSFSANYPIIAPSLLLDFANSNTVDPRVTFTRASTATYFNSIGSLTTAAINSPRLDYDPTTLASQGLLIEEQRVNSIRNNTMVGAVAGTPGNLPTNWQVVNTAGLSTSVIGFGVEAGVSYVDVRVFGTTTNTTFTLSSELGGTISAITGQAWASSNYIKIVAGATTNISTIELGWSEQNSTPAFLNFNMGVISVATTGSLAANRRSYAATNLQATTAFIRPALNLGLTAIGAAIDITLRIGLPQLEQGAFATSVIPTSPTFTSRASTGTYFDSTGTLQTAAINVARNNYNPASLSTPPLLLIEEARTNSIRNNTGVGAVAGTPGTLPTNWVVQLSGLTQTVVGTGTSAGISYIDIRVNGTTTSAGGVQIKPDGNAGVIAATAAQTWAFSTWAAVVGGSTNNITGQKLYINEYSAGPTYLRTATVATAILAGGATFARVSGAISTGASTTIIEPIIVLEAASGAAIDITLRIGLPQLELGAYPTSVIPTTTVAVTRSADLFTQAAVTRSADVASVTTLSPWFNATAGSLYAEFTASANANTVYAALSTGAMGQNSFYFDNDSGLIRNVVFSSSSSQAAMSTGAIGTVGAINKVAGAYTVNDFAVSRNGGASVTDTSGAVPLTMSQLDIGRNPNAVASTYVNGYIRRIAYYPVRLSNANLQALTS